MRAVDGTPGGGSSEGVPRRALVAAPLIGIATFLAMVIASAILDLPIHDPDGGPLGSPLVLIVVVMLAFIALDVVPRAAARAGWPPRNLPRATRELLRERWSPQRLVVVVGALLGFYLTYVGYRNLKSFLPFARSANYDQALLNVDRDLFFGHDPGVVLHDLLGSGISAHILSSVYLTFLLFVPFSLGVAVVWQRRLHRGLWYVTAMNFAWLFGVTSYYVLPSLGPAFAAPQLYASLPNTGVTTLQQSLLAHRGEVISSPQATDGVQSIAAFASLHIAIVLAAALIAQLLGLRRVIRAVLWTFLVLTVLATIYFGWHYVIDDLAGAVIGVAAVVLGAAATGHELRPNAGSRVPVLSQRTARTT